MRLHELHGGNPYQLLMERVLPDPLFIHDHDGRMVAVNSRACTSLGYERDELLSMNVLDIEQDFDLRAAQAVWSGMREESTTILYGHQRRKNGSIFPVEVHFGLLETGERRL